MALDRLHSDSNKIIHSVSKTLSLSSIVGNQAMNYFANSQSEFNSQAHRQVIQRYWSEEFPETEENMMEVINFVEGLNRPTWDADIRNTVFEEYYVGKNKAPYLEEGRMVYKDVDAYHCAVCGKIMERGDMHVGHKMDWKDFLIASGVIDVEEAHDAFNNIENLRIECPTCNLSHKHELTRPKDRIDFLMKIEDEVMSNCDEDEELMTIWNEIDMRSRLLEAILNVEAFSLDKLTDYLGVCTFTGLELDVDNSNRLLEIVLKAIEKIMNSVEWEEVLSGELE